MCVLIPAPHQLVVVCHCCSSQSFSMLLRVLSLHPRTGWPGQTLLKGLMVTGLQPPDCLVCSTVSQCIWFRFTCFYCVFWQRLDATDDLVRPCSIFLGVGSAFGFGVAWPIFQWANPNYLNSKWPHLGASKIFNSQDPKNSSWRILGFAYILSVYVVWGRIWRFCGKERCIPEFRWSRNAQLDSEEKHMGDRLRSWVRRRAFLCQFG